MIENYGTQLYYSLEVTKNFVQRLVAGLALERSAIPGTHTGQISATKVDLDVEFPATRSGN